MKDLIRELQKLSAKKEIKSSDHLKNDLHLDSMKLIELVVIISEQWGIDLGQMAANGYPVSTVSDIQKIIETVA
jgi:acyl carrier protein